MILAIVLTLAAVLAIGVLLNRITRQQYVGRIMERIQDEAIELIDDLPYGSRIGVRVGEPVATPEISDFGAALVIRGPGRRVGPAGQIAVVPIFRPPMSITAQP
jgi:hypothetical protein